MMSNASSAQRFRARSNIGGYRFGKPEKNQCVIDQVRGDIKQDSLRPRGFAQGAGL